MSAAHDRLVVEIHKMLDELAEAKRPWVGSWITNAIIINHEAGLSDDPDKLWWEGNGRDHVFDEVRRVINVRAGDPDPEADEEERKQPKLPGFKHLHIYYRNKRWFKAGKMVPRGTKDAEPERVGVHIENMTDSEVTSKARLYSRNSRSMAEHSDELLEYLDQRMKRKGPIITER